MKGSRESETLGEARESFIGQWCALGSAWGINRTMAQLHALLLTSSEPRSTDDVMATLGISRGNANTNLRELVHWGLVRKVLRKGERREFFVAEKDVWQMFCIIARERKRRELEPALAAVQACAGATKGLRGAEAKAFHGQMKALAEFIQLGSSMMERVAQSEQSKLIPALLKLLK